MQAPVHNLGYLGDAMETLKPSLESSLKSTLDASGFLSDVVERSYASLAHPASVDPWKAFNYRLYSSAAAATAIRALLQCKVPGTTASYATILSAIATETSSSSASSHHCYIIGGQVRDVLRGVLSDDFDFSYSCSAKEAATVCVSHEWTTKYKCVGTVDTPNYVLVGDESSPFYLEGFSVTFNSTTACYNMDFRQNMLFYDLSNEVIIDKTGHGVDDIRGRALRLSCAGAADETFEQWAAATITPGFKELRYIKFLLRAQGQGQPMASDAEETAFVVSSLKAAMRSNAEALRGFWFSHALEKQLRSAEGVAALRAWVVQHGGSAWWYEDWAPLVQASAAATAGASTSSNSNGSSKKDGALASDRRRRWILGQRKRGARAVRV